MKNWWHVRCLHFMSKLLIYKQLWLSYSKLYVFIFATFQFFMFWFKTDFVKWKLQFCDLLFDLKWKNEFQKISFIFQIWLMHLKRKNENKSFSLHFDLKSVSKNKNWNFRIHEFQNVLSFSNSGYEIEKWKMKNFQNSFCF